VNPRPLFWFTAALPLVFATAFGQAQLLSTNGIVESSFASAIPSLGTTFSFSPDGRYLASAGHDGRIDLWKVAEGERHRTLEGHTATVSQLAFSSDSTLLASASEDKSVRIWTIATGEAVQVFEGFDQVYSLAFSPQSDLLAVSGTKFRSGLDKESSAIRLWNIDTGNHLKDLVLSNHTRPEYRNLQFSPDGQYLATLMRVDSTGEVFFIDLSGAGKSLRFERQRPVQSLDSLRLTPNGETAYVGASTNSAFEVIYRVNYREAQFATVVEAERFSTDPAASLSPYIVGVTKEDSLLLTFRGRVEIDGRRYQAIQVWWTESGEPLGQMLVESSSINLVAVRTINNGDILLLLSNGEIHRMANPEDQVARFQARQEEQRLAAEHAAEEEAARTAAEAEAARAEADQAARDKATTREAEVEAARQSRDRAAEEEAERQANETDSHPLFVAAREGTRTDIRAAIFDSVTATGSTEIIDLQNSAGQTPLMVAARYNSDFHRPHNAASVVEELIDIGANLDARDVEGKTPFMYALLGYEERGAGSVVWTILDKLRPVDVNAADETGMTVLMYAARYGNPTLVRNVLAAGAEAMAHDISGKTALMYAAESAKDIDVIRHLLEAGESITTTDGSGATAADYALRNSHLSAEVTQLLEYELTVKRISEALAADPQYILKIARDGTLVEQQVVIELSSRLSVEDEFGQGALIYAAGNNTADVIEALVKAGLDINNQSHTGWTPLMFAARRSNPEVINVLIELGANPDLTNDEGKTAELLDPEMQAVKEALRGKDYDAALSILRPLAEAGVYYAQHRLGFLYEFGNGVPQDLAEAARWQRLSAEQGYSWAQNKLGSMHSMGLGVPRNSGEASKWYRRAADQGHAYALMSLAVQYRTGDGVRENEREAVRLLRLLLEQDSDEARAMSDMAEPMLDELETEIAQAEAQRQQQRTEAARQPGANGSRVLGVDFPTPAKRDYGNSDVRGLAAPVYQEYQSRRQSPLSCSASETLVWDNIVMTREGVRPVPDLSQLASQVASALNTAGFGLVETHTTRQPAFFPGMGRTAFSEAFLLRRGDEDYVMSYWTGSESTYGSYLAVYSFRGPCR
jgi:ankyrin repeat protein